MFHLEDFGETVAIYGKLNQAYTVKATGVDEFALYIQTV